MTTATTTPTTAPPTDHHSTPGGSARTATTRHHPRTREQEEPARWQHGQVAWFNTEKGFGFLTPDTGPAVFVDHQVIEVCGFKTLVDGQPVVFTAAHTPRGPEATRVVPYIRAHTTGRPCPTARPHQP